MKKTIVILAMSALGLTTVNAGVHIGISFGIQVPAPVVAVPAPVVAAPAPVVVPSPMPAPVVEVVPVCPRTEYVWVGGSWGWCNNHWMWTRGHWGPPAHWGYGYHAEHHEGFHGGFHWEHEHR